MNIDKIKTQIGEQIYSHINTLSETELKNMKSALMKELTRIQNNPPHTLNIDLKTALQRETKLYTELNYINYKLS